MKFPFKKASHPSSAASVLFGDVSFIHVSAVLQTFAPIIGCFILDLTFLFQGGVVALIWQPD